MCTEAVSKVCYCEILGVFSCHWSFVLSVHSAKRPINSGLDFVNTEFMCTATNSQGKAVVRIDTSGASFDKKWKIHEVSKTEKNFKDGRNGHCNNVYFNLQRILLTILFQLYNTRNWVSRS